MINDLPNQAIGSIDDLGSFDSPDIVVLCRSDAARRQS